VLRRLAVAVRPGGVLLVEEDDIYPVVATAEGAYRAAWDVGAELEGQLFPGGSEIAQFWSLTWLLEDPARWFHGPAKVAAWGRPR
jgi:hypothetical protein